MRTTFSSKSETAKVIETVLHEEGRSPESVFDFVQGITALARGIPSLSWADGQVAKMAVCAVVYPQTYCSVGIGTMLQIVNKEHGLCGSADVELGGRARYLDP
jgi:hypothetical protein